MAVHDDVENAMAKGLGPEHVPMQMRGGQNSPVFVVSQVQSCNMGPLGLFGFAWTTALLSMVHTHKVSSGAVSLVYCFALGYGGLAQLLAGMWEARRGKMFGAVAFSSYGAFWISLGIFGIVKDTGIFTASGALLEGLQTMLALWAVVTFLFFLNTLALNIALSCLFFMLTLTFCLLAGGETVLGSEKAGGWCGMITAAIAFYIGFAELTNDTLKKDVIPLGPLTWATRVFHTPAPAYNVNLTDPRGFGGAQRVVVPSERAALK